MNKLTLIFLFFLFCGKFSSSQIIGGELINHNTRWLQQEVIDSIRVQNVQRHLNYLSYYRDSIICSKDFCKRMQNEYLNFENFIRPTEISNVEISEAIKEKMAEQPFLIAPFTTLLPGHAPPGFSAYLGAHSDNPSASTLIKGYTLYVIYDNIFKNMGIIALNDTDNTDIRFIGGNYLPLDNMLPVRLDIFTRLREKNLKPYRDKYSKVSYWYRDSLKIPLEYRFYEIYGYEIYGTIIGMSFIASNRIKGNVVEYKDGVFTVRVESGVDKYKKDKFSIRAYYWDPNRQDTTQIIGKVKVGCSYIRPCVPCNDYNGKIVESLLVKIDVRTGLIQVKIEEMKNIRRVRECPD